MPVPPESPSAAQARPCWITPIRAQVSDEIGEMSPILPLLRSSFSYRRKLAWLQRERRGGNRRVIPQRHPNLEKMHRGAS